MTTTASKAEYTISIENEAGIPLSGIDVFVYEDATKTELVSVGTTGDGGTVSFTDFVRDSYTATLKDVPDVYSAEEQYLLEGEHTTIILRKREMTEDELKDYQYSLGDTVMDFSITDCDGNEYKFSELLSEKKMVILNFWYLNCMPCKMEFPYLQEVYEQYSTDIEILAMNPVDGDDASIGAYKNELGLSFPMAKSDLLWQNLMNIKAYPTTVVIDRFGCICFVHQGMFMDSTDVFRVVKYFTSDNYEPKVFESIGEIPE